MGLKIDQWDLIHLARYSYSMQKAYEKTLSALKDKLDKCSDAKEKSMLMARIDKAEAKILYHDFKQECFVDAMEDDTRDFYFACC